jgi:hypothetical protein
MNYAKINQATIRDTAIAVSLFDLRSRRNHRSTYYRRFTALFKLDFRAGY